MGCSVTFDLITQSGGGRAGLRFGRLEEPERAQSLACRFDQHAIEGVAFRQAELPPDDLVVVRELPTMLMRSI